MDGPDVASLRRRMAVFADGATLDAAVAVCAREHVEPEVVVDLLSILVANSLLDGVEREGERRYRLSTADRSRCRKELATNGELEALRTRHAAYYAEWGVRECRRLGGAERATARQAVECDLPNLYAALDWLIVQEDVTRALGLAGWLRAFWWDAGRESEGLAWFARLLALPALAGRTAQRAAARPPLVEALSLAQVPGMEAQRAAVLINLGQVATLVGDGAEARRCFAEALPVFLQREQVTPLPFVLENLAALAAADGEPARALRLASAAARQRRLFEFPDLAPHLRAGLGDFQERARAALGREAAQTAWTAGQTLSLEQALAGGWKGDGTVKCRADCHLALSHAPTRNPF
jgi:hypothetical protein